MNLRHISFGKGKKTMVVVPGLSIGYVTDEALALENAFSMFAEEYTVHVFDVREDVPQGYSIERMGEDLVTAIQSLGLKDLYLFGCSMGGMESLYIAGRYPKLVKKLVTGASAAKANTTSQSVVGNWISLAEEKLFQELVENMGQRIFSPEIYAANLSAFQAMAAGLTEKLAARFIRTAEAVYHVDITEYAANIQCPVLVLGSEGDKVLTARASEKIADITGGELYLYGNEYPHAVYDLAPDFRIRVKNFFDAESYSSVK